MNASQAVDAGLLDETGPSTYSLAILRGLQRHERAHPGSIYQGTVDPAEKARRRAKNRAARRARRAGR